MALAFGLSLLPKTRRSKNTAQTLMLELLFVRNDVSNGDEVGRVEILNLEYDLLPNVSITAFHNGLGRRN